MFHKGSQHSDASVVVLVASKAYLLDRSRECLTTVDIMRRFKVHSVNMFDDPIQNTPRPNDYYALP